MRPNIPNVVNEKAAFVRNSDGHTIASTESNVLFFDGLPTYFTRRESGDKAIIFCFVEFDNSKCAMVGMEALQGNLGMGECKPRRLSSPGRTEIGLCKFKNRLSSVMETQSFVVASDVLTH
ncbi:hypothetical protein DITRI_Ditri03aG0036500 [Diplodiscus trichospermus]